MRASQLLVLALLAYAGAAESASARRRQLQDGCVCPALYKPVCGADGKSYGNSCEASCAKVKVVSEGRCGGELPGWRDAGGLAGCVARPHAMRPCSRASGKMPA
jgi:hypothetical protein